VLLEIVLKTFATMLLAISLLFKALIQACFCGSLAELEITAIERSFVGDLTIMGTWSS
jgi:hypothetical protein